MTALLIGELAKTISPRRQPKCLDNAANVARLSRATNRFLKWRDTSTVGNPRRFFATATDLERKKNDGETCSIGDSPGFSLGGEAFDANSASMLFFFFFFFFGRIYIRLQLSRENSIEIDSESIKSRLKLLNINMEMRARFITEVNCKLLREEIPCYLILWAKLIFDSRSAVTFNNKYTFKQSFKCSSVIVNYKYVLHSIKV